MANTVGYMARPRVTGKRQGNESWRRWLRVRPLKMDGQSGNKMEHISDTATDTAVAGEGRVCSGKPDD